MIWEEYKRKWLRENICNFCQGSRMHTCTSYKCQPAYKEAGRYLEQVIARDMVASGKRVYVIRLFPHISKSFIVENEIAGIWLLSDNRKEEIIIQFHNIIPRMQQGVYVVRTERYLKKLAAISVEKQKESIFSTLAENIRVRAWKKSDGEKIESGIPVKVNEIAGKECSNKEEKDG